MTTTSAIGAQPSYASTAPIVRPPGPTTKPVDSDGDHDGDRGARPSGNGHLRVTA